jgi:hypothetical protein
MNLCGFDAGHAQSGQRPGADAGSSERPLLLTKMLAALLGCLGGLYAGSRFSDACGGLHVHESEAGPIDWVNSNVRIAFASKCQCRILPELVCLVVLFKRF